MPRHPAANCNISVDNFGIEDHVTVMVAVTSVAFAIKEMNFAFRNVFRNVNIGDDFFACYDEMLTSIKDHPLARAKKTSTETRGIVKAKVNDALRCFDVMVLPAFDQHSRLTSLVMIICDITDGQLDGGVEPARDNLFIERKDKNHQSDDKRLSEENHRLIQINVELQRKNTELISLTVSDPLTGLYNRRAFDLNYERELRRAERYNHPLSLLFLDIDHFRNFNNNYDYDTGDAVLRNVARLITEDVRDTDIVTRYGGEEFVVILPETSAGFAEKIAERVRQSIQKSPTQSKFGELSVTISVGVVTTYDSVIDGEAFLNTAVAALHEAKQTGRNKVIARELAKEVKSKR